MRGPGLYSIGGLVVTVLVIVRLLRLLALV